MFKQLSAEFVAFAIFGGVLFLAALIYSRIKRVFTKDEDQDELDTERSQPGPAQEVIEGEAADHVIQIDHGNEDAKVKNSNTDDAQPRASTEETQDTELVGGNKKRGCRGKVTADGVMGSQPAVVGSGGQSKNVLFAVAIVAILLLGLFVWPGLYIYTSSTISGNTIPVRINRITGTTERLLGSRGWVVLESETAKKPEVGTKGWLEGKWSIRIGSVVAEHKKAVDRARVEAGNVSWVARHGSKSDSEFFEKYPLPYKYVADFHSDGSVTFTKVSTSTGALFRVENGSYNLDDGTLFLSDVDISSFAVSRTTTIDYIYQRIYFMAEDSFSILYDGLGGLTFSRM